MKTLIKNADLILPDKIMEDGWLASVDGVIDDFGSGTLPGGEFDQVVDAKGEYLSPGFVDTHVHGAMYCDFSDGTKDSILPVMRRQLEGGTTSITPTLTSLTHSQYLKCFEAFNALIPSFEGMSDIPDFEGIHMEGPYSSGATLGAQDTTTYRDPDFREIDQYMEMAPYIRKWTAAPERKGGMAFGRFCEKHGIVASIGHSNATLAEAFEAFDNGYKNITHLYSACSSYHRNGAYREGGIVEAAWLIDDMDVEMITDGKHLPAEFLQLIYKIKGPDHISMITDSTRFGGMSMPEGTHVFYDSEKTKGIWLENGVALVENKSCFAGSTATTDRLVRTATQIAGIDLVDTIRMMCLTPARVNGFADKVGSIARGKRANLVIFDDDVNIHSVFLKGRKVK
ncbi:MAG: amidohydrolase family protein [Sphaerochaetaceae bacterium]|jgi:N-acetylglucosamine-6-phosphate deacetylase|nr:amidohydrolase family protein [Sphaerochaetaceae bacterium]